MFKTIDNQLTSIFQKTKDVNYGFEFSYNALNRFINKFEKINLKQEFGEDWDDLLDSFNDKNQNLADYFKNLAKEGASARASIEGVYAAILNGNTKGFSNVKSILTEFNKLGNNAEGQQAFAAAVGQTNRRLGEYLTGLNGTNASMRGYVSELVTSTVKTTALQAATLALNAAMTIGIATAVSTIIRKFSDMANAYQQNINKMNDLSEQVKGIEGEIESLNSELKEGIEKLYELEAIETPNLFEQAEIDRLKEYNEELERQIRLKKYELQDANDQANQASQKYIDGLNLGVNPFENTDWWEWLLGSATGGLYWAGKAAVGTGSELIQGDTYVQKLDTLKKYEKEVGEYKQVFNHYAQIEKDYQDGILNKDDYDKYCRNLENGLKKRKETIQKLEKDLYNERKDFEAALLGLDQDDPNNEKNIHQLQDFIDRYDKTRLSFNNPNHLDFISVYENADFAETVTQLESLAKKGKLTEDTFNETKGINAFKNALNEIGITDVNFMVDSIIDHVTDTGNSCEETEKFLSDFKETLDSAFSDQSTIQSAYDKIQQGSSLSANEVRKLTELCPELANEFTKTADGYTIDSERLVEANERVTKNTRDSITERINALKEYIDQTKTINNQYDAKKLSESQTELESLELVLSMLEISGNKIANTFEKLDESFSKLTSKAKTLSSALQEQDKAGTLSADTIMNIVDAGYASALVFDQVTGKVTLNKEAYIQLAQAEYDEQIANLEMLRTFYETNTVLSNITSNTNGAIGSIYGIASAFLELQKSISDTPEQITEIDARIAALKTARDNVGNYGTTGNGTDHIREAFEAEMKDIEHLHNMGLISDEKYYNALEEANENHYKNSLEHESEYLSNKEKIYNGRKNIYKEEVDKEVSELEEAFDKGFITAQELKSKLQQLAETKYGIGTIYYGTEFASENYADLTDKAKNVNYDIYKERLDELRKADDGSLESHQAFIEKWRKLAAKMFEEVDPKKYKSLFSIF